MRTHPLLGLALLGAVAALALSACAPSSPSGVSPTPAGSSLAAEPSSAPGSSSPGAGASGSAVPTGGSAATGSPSPSSAASAAGEASVSLGETSATVTLYGSSSCPPKIASSAVSGGVLKITLEEQKGTGACTADLAPHEFTVQLTAEDIASIRSAVYVTQGLEHRMQLAR